LKQDKKKIWLTTFIKRSTGRSVALVLDVAGTLARLSSWLVDSANKGDADIPGVLTASECGWGGATVVCWGPACPTDETPDNGFSESTGMGDGAKGVEGVTTKGEFADGIGALAFGIDDNRPFWSIWGEEWWEICGDEAW